MKKLILASLITCVSLCAYAQVPVSIITPPKYQGFLANGSPNAFGCLFFFQSGTSTPLAAYTDYSGVTLLPNPTVLDASGSASVWLQTGVLYRIVVKTTGGINCAAGATVSTTDGMNGSLLLSSNTWQQPQIFDDPIQILAPDLQIVFGASSGNQTTLDVPPSSSNLILHSPPITANDTLLSQNATQTVQNKNLTAGTQINGCGVINGPGTYVCIANNGSAPTILNSLAILSGAPSTATVAPITANSAVGIVVGNAGITGNAIIQKSGTPSCNFDNATVAGDSFVPSITVAGNCHDTGSSSSSPGSQGIVLSTNAGSGLFQVLLSGQSSSSLVSADGSLTTVNGNTTAFQLMKVTQLAQAGALNVLNKTFRVTSHFVVTPGGGSSTNRVELTLGPSLSSVTTAQDMNVATSNASTWSMGQTSTCSVRTIGATGTIFCTVTITAPTVGTPTNGVLTFTGIDLTGPLFVGNECSFTVASTSNTCNQGGLVVEQLN